jgi:histidinol dehydrogenase
MRLLRHTDIDFREQFSRIVSASSLFDPEVERRTGKILADVASRGDAALTELTRRFDGAHLVGNAFKVSPEEHIAASGQASKSIRAAIREAHDNIARFARKSLRTAWKARNSHGAIVGEKFDPFARVGIYIPGGTAPLVSTALMTVTLAEVAGCPEIAVCTPPADDGRINPILLYAAHTAGATEIYKVGGAQAIAALAHGTDTIPPVQKVFGPGNAYVVAAKRLLFGRVAIDLLPGPSEVLVLADRSANAAHVASDLLAQAEHGSGRERVWLVTPSLKLIEAVQREIQRQLQGLQRREYIQKALNHGGWLIHAESIQHATELVNALAPEHCEIHAQRARTLVPKITTAGAIFVGGASPTVLGDYVAGPSHTLPTGGAGKCFAGLTTDQFQRRTSVVEYNAASLKRALPAIRAFAMLEGLDAHGASAEMRFRA